MAERNEERKFVAWANEHDITTLKLGSVYNSSWPDRLVIGHKKRLIFIEFKSPGKVQTKLQQNTAANLEQRGFKVYVVYSKKEAVRRCEENRLTI